MREVRLKISKVPILKLRGFLLSLLLLAPSIIGLLSGLNFYLSLMATGLVLLLLIILCLVDYYLSRHVYSNLEFAFKLPPALSSEKEQQVTISVSYSGQIWPVSFLLRPRIPERTRVKQETFHVCLPSSEFRSLELNYLFTPISRGEIGFSPLYLRLNGIAKLLSWPAELLCGELEGLNVYPNANLDTGDKVFLLRPRIQGQTLGPRKGIEGREFDSLRLYTAGDELRRVDWKRSAKRDKLVVRTYRPEGHQRVSIFLDCSRRSSNYVDDRLQLDYACDAVATLARLATTQNDEVGLQVFSHRTIANVRHAKGQQQNRLILETLKQIEPEALDPNYTIVTKGAHSSRRRSLLVLVTSITNPASIDRIQSALEPTRARHLPLLVAVSDRKLAELSIKRANDLEDAYIVAAANEQLCNIELGQKRLKRAGIDCVYSDAKNLGAMLVDKYVSLKRSGRI